MAMMSLSESLAALGFLLLALIPLGCVVAFLVINTGGSWRGLLVGVLLGLVSLGAIAGLFVVSERLNAPDRFSRSRPVGGHARSDASGLRLTSLSPETESASGVFATHIDLTNWPLMTKWSADRHPTRDRALEALAARVVRELREGVASCSRIVVAGEHKTGIVRDAVRALRLQADQLAVTGGSDDAGPDETTAVLAVRELERAGGGTIHAQLAYQSVGDATTSKVFTATYDDAAWVVKDPALADPTETVIVGRSGVEPGTDQARTAAEGQAFRRLTEMVRMRLSASDVPRGARWLLGGDRLEGFVRPIALANGWGYAAPFVQTFDSAQGALSRAAVLSAPVDVLRISEQVARRIEAYRSGWLVQGLSVVVLGGLIYLGYRVLDGGTRGHFTWRLRLASLAMFVAATTVTLFVVA